MRSHQILISLEVAADGEHLKGTVAEEAGEARPFTGWLGLVGAIDAIVASGAAATELEETT